MFQTKAAEKIKKTPYILKFFFLENRGVYEIMWKYIVQPDRPQMTIQYGACALHAGYLRVQTHTQNIEYILLLHWRF